MHHRAPLRRKQRQSSVRRLPRRAQDSGVVVSESAVSAQEAVDEAQRKHSELGPASAGLSGDQQGLPQTARASGESVEGLAAAEETYEASLVEGVEQAGDNPERPVRVRSSDEPLSDDELASEENSRER